MGKKLFDYVIGNPPYQDNTKGDNATCAPPVYNHFMDEAYKVADKIELIHPARFLFNAGSTPKEWNQKILHDPHFKILHYEEDCSKIFSNTEIKGGIAISYRDENKEFGGIEIFTPQQQLNTILRKIKDNKTFQSISSIVITRTAYRLSDVMHKEHPEAIGQLSNGHAYDMSSNIFERLPQIFFDTKPNDNFEYIHIWGRINNERTLKWIRKDYIRVTKNTYKYKVVIPQASGSGEFGETISLPLVGKPSEGTTETFITIGSFDLETEAENAKKYICTKFCRALLGVLKRTQALSPDKWQYVLLQDFIPLRH